ncbi:MAG: hypothetical protein SFX73_27825 [Kofleriaceae bacterium]|nr:hypothetical protein [Kofleriaceae bacterium]
MRRAWPVAIAVAVVATTKPAHAYEFWLRAQAMGQAYQLRQYQLVGPDLFQGRRRYTQTLALRITDVGDLRATRRKQRLPDRGVTIGWQSYLRIDHDFGSFASGSIALAPAVRRDVIDVIPELAEQVAGLDLLYGHVMIDGLADDRVHLNVGRVLLDDGWGTYGVDGVTGRAQLSVPVAIEAFAGLRVRARSPLGLSTFELDGTSGAGCQEYVEGPTPGTGTWKLIDRDRLVNGSRLASDFEVCPQRAMRQPTIGVALSTRTRRWGAEVGYRRTWSETPGLIDDPERATYPDTGLYPDEVGQAPATGINEERLYARVHGRLRAGAFTLAPYANARVSLLHAALDRADAGVRVQRGAHVLEPSVDYFLPTFDGDSIFNVFSIEPTTDARLAYTYDGGVRLRASAWLRRYAHDDVTSSYSGGADAGLERALGRRSRGRLDVLWDDGYGGRRVGGSGEAGWQARDWLWLRGRVIGLGVRPDDRAAYVTGSAVGSGSFKLADGLALHLLTEVDVDEVYKVQGRLIGVLDFAFAPEP